MKNINLIHKYIGPEQNFSNFLVIFKWFFGKNRSKLAIFHQLDITSGSALGNSQHIAMITVEIHRVNL